MYLCCSTPYYAYPGYVPYYAAYPPYGVPPPGYAEPQAPQPKPISRWRSASPVPTQRMMAG